MFTRQSCSWCHEPNDVTAGPTYCRTCGHRADVCRLECTCPACQRAARPELPAEPVDFKHDHY